MNVNGSWIQKVCTMWKIGIGVHEKKNEFSVCLLNLIRSFALFFLFPVMIVGCSPPSLTFSDKGLSSSYSDPQAYLIDSIKQRDLVAVMRSLKTDRADACSDRRRS